MLVCVSFANANCNMVAAVLRPNHVYHRKYVHKYNIADNATGDNNQYYCNRGEPRTNSIPYSRNPPSDSSRLKRECRRKLENLQASLGNYAIIMNIHQQPETYQLALFLHCIGPEALKIFNGMPFENPQEREKLESIIQKFDEFTIGETNETYERYLFNSWNQSPEETFDAYVVALRTLSQTCTFCECIRESPIRDRTVWGTQNPQTRKTTSTAAKAHTQHRRMSTE